MLAFDTPFMIVTGLLAGLAFGFLLQRGGVTRYSVILNQFLFRDFTVLKVMLTAIVTGAVGIWGMRAMGMDVAMSVKKAPGTPCPVQSKLASTLWVGVRRTQKASPPTPSRGLQNRK